MARSSRAERSDEISHQTGDIRDMTRTSKAVLDDPSDAGHDAVHAWHALIDRTRAVRGVLPPNRAISSRFIVCADIMGP